MNLARRHAVRIRAITLAAVVASSVASAQTPPPTWASTLFVNDVEPAPTESKCRCSDPATQTRSELCFPVMLVHDAGRVFMAPARWKKRDWGMFAAAVAGVGALMAVDERVRTRVLEGEYGFQDRVANAIEPLGTWGSFVVLGGFYFGGLAAHDDKARGVALDGLAASVISGIIITPTLKFIAGRSRPNAGLGPYHFEPFHGGPAFPSGHATQAFTVASVIATEYPSRWVKAACYVPATIVLYARMRHDAHWASDVTAGALIGYGVGRSVARFNLQRREGKPQVRLLPVFAPGVSGVALTVRL